MKTWLKQIGQSIKDFFRGSDGGEYPELDFKQQWAEDFVPCEVNDSIFGEGEFHGAVPETYEDIDAALADIFKPYEGNGKSVYPKSAKPCLSGRGKPKRAFTSKAKALEFTAERHIKMQRPYKCSDHGWHLTSELSHGLTDAIAGAKRKKANKKKNKPKKVARRVTAHGR